MISIWLSLFTIRAFQFPLESSRATLPESIWIYNCFPTVFRPRAQKIRGWVTCAPSGNVVGNPTSQISYLRSRSRLFSYGLSGQKSLYPAMIVTTYDLALLITRKSFSAPLPLKREGKPRTCSKEAKLPGISRATLTMNSLFITRNGALLVLRAKRSR